LLDYLKPKNWRLVIPVCIILILLATHIPLAGLALPFILFAAYRAMIGEYAAHKKLVRYISPVWLYVAVTGVLIYWMIAPFYK
jgi:putative membrane protein